MQTNKSFSTSEALRFGWETFKKKPIFWIVVTLIIGGLSATDRIGNSSNGQMDFSSTPPIIFISAFVLGLILTYILMGLQMGAYKAAFGTLEGKEPKFSMLTSDFEPARIIKYILMNIALALMVILGLVAFVIPGIYLGLKYQFAAIFYLEKNTSFSDSFKLSAEATNGVKILLLGFWLIAIGIYFIGALAFGLGIFVSVPVVFLANVFIYRKLSTSSINMVPPAAPVYQADVARN